MIKMVILDQSKPISLILKREKSKIQKSEICKLHVSTTCSKIEFYIFMFNNNFCEMNIKKVTNGVGKGGNHPNFQLEL